jgi:Putative beta-barrel porin 2
MTCFSSRLLLLVLMALLSATANAQAQIPETPDEGPDPAHVRVRIGVLWLNPTIALSNVGVDTNVFNEPPGQNPKRDFTATVTPAADLWLHMGRSWLSGNVKESFVWYQKQASERSANDSYTVGWRMPANRVLLAANATFLQTRDRPGFEIDARSDRTELGYGGALELRALARTFVGFKANRQNIGFDKDAFFLDSSLRTQLNRTSTSASLSLRHQLTPLTSLGLEVTRSEDRFDLSPLRDSNSTSYSGTVRLDPAALIKGSASFGYRDFEPVDAGLPPFKGATVAIDLAYSVFGTTRFSVEGTRDVQYSFDINQPYYLLTGFSGSVAQQLFGPVDVVARAGTRRLSYRDRTGGSIAISNRTDFVHTYGGSVGYHMGRDWRLSFNVDRQNRVSDFAQREYDDLRIGTALTYGF